MADIASSSIADQSSAGQIMMRDMQTQDLRAVTHIEQIAQLSPWARLSFEEALTREHLCRIAELEKKIIGYWVACPVVDEMHLLNLVIADAYQQQGYSHILMDDLLSCSLAASKEKLFLEVRAGNTAAISLYRKWGFEQIANRANYYRGSLTASQANSREDAVVMMRALPD